MIARWNAAWDPAVEWFLQANFTAPGDKASHWFLGEKHHYGLSFISAVLGQFKPTQRTLSGSITETMMDGKSMNGSLTIRADAKMSVKPVITFLLASEAKTFAAAKFGLVNQTSGLRLTIPHWFMLIQTIPVNNVTSFTEAERTRPVWHQWKFFNCGCVRKTPGQCSLFKYAVNSSAVGHKAVKSHRSEFTSVIMC